MATPSEPRFEHHREALGIGEAAPRLSWKTTARAGWRQRSYDAEITRESGAHEVVSIDSPESVLVPWPWEPLRSRESARVRVRVTGDDGIPSRWSLLLVTRTC